MQSGNRKTRQTGRAAGLISPSSATLVQETIFVNGIPADLRERTFSKKIVEAMGEDEFNSLDKEEISLFIQYKDSLDSSDLSLEDFRSSTKNLPDDEIKRFLQYMKEGKASICDPWRNGLQDGAIKQADLTKCRNDFACWSLFNYLKSASGSIEQIDSSTRREAIRKAKQKTIFEVYVSEFKALSNSATKIANDEQFTKIIGRYREISRQLYTICALQEDLCDSFKPVLINLRELEKQREHTHGNAVLSKYHIEAINMILELPFSPAKKILFLSTMDFKTLRVLNCNNAAIKEGIHTLHKEESIQDYFARIIEPEEYCTSYFEVAP